MKRPLSEFWSPSSVFSDQALRFIAIIAWSAILVGAASRLGQLPTRDLYVDEAITQMRVAGHTDSEMMETLYDGAPRSALRMRHDASVNSDATIGALLSSLMKEDAQHPPLFYVAELLFVRAFGNSLLIWRFLPALFGLLALPAAYALARELFHDAHAGLIAAALFAVSPLQRIYSEQAREYSLLTLLLLCSSFLLIRAMRTGSSGSWILYVVLATAGLYASPFMAYAIAAHAVYVGGVGWGSRRVVAFAVALIAVLGGYTPWLYELIINRNVISSTNVWSAGAWPIARLVAKWIFNTGSIFFDLEYLNVKWAIVLVVVLLFASLTIVRGFVSVKGDERWFLATAIVVPAALLIVPDIVLVEHRSSVARYGLPVYAMLTILIARGLIGRPLATTVLLIAALVSSVVGTLYPSWWDNDANADDKSIASIINSIPHAQVISHVAPPEFLTFARLLNDDVKVSLSRDLARTSFSQSDPLFVLRPTASELADLKSRTNLAFVPVSYPRATTAHEIGMRIGNDATLHLEPIALYRAERRH